ncbi:response regulator [Paenibacillus sacheonensis]|uniref:Response regulator n=1 Tax=Paenibacillus sacheonensis TaxID=742054 RepID=A0A7X5BZA2_9BACL|nr:response regulator [Paenibacillus sacheonensis]MBM7563435.1 two-component system response regulator YesN [Paenibacillus sacheonensis]NBC68010.1 response regulator [Paenibacillus sacheonensis]
MYDVLIVEDEPIARESLKYLIDWQALGFEIKGEAENGQQALAMMRGHYYSLVLTDIRMPVMSGLEFIAELRKFSGAEVIILTGYDDFEYARQGLKLGVQDYLLKPVDEDDLAAVIERIKGDLDLKYRTRKQLDLGVSALRDRFFKQWAHGQVKAGEFLEQSKLLGVSVDWPSTCCLVVEMDFVQALHAYWTDQELSLKRFAIRNIIEDVCGDGGSVFEESEERFAVLCKGSGDEKDDLSGAFQLAERLASAISLYAKETVSIGVGHVVDSREAVPQSFAAAEKALDGKFLHGKNAILTGMPGEAKDTEQTELRAMEENVIEAMKTFRLDRVREALHALKEAYRSSRVEPGVIKLRVLEQLIQLFHVVKEAGANHALLFDSQFGDYDHVMTIRTIDELHRFIEDKCLSAFELLVRMKEQQPNKVFVTVQKLVQEQFQTPISLRSIAQQVYMNPHYLGKLFKANAGTSFNEYLLRIRMEKAKELLRFTDKKVYEIAQEVGFGELDWFYKRFKLYTGLSAGEYRSAYQPQSKE